ncbi:hypothetical protein N7474_003755 [Penicillium riverlandense]|uniref:uncharacterized protein n=1 Tax=Penicillium riverlandense TaxID=1903569 RepID=UPI002548ADE3|nr:uncharacterized protein N7474_003755 [Penicillium riverlandense]KAJ5818164.1 hypothetical protein N7474_003755 [Penicillium riverlandense]
MTRAASTDTTPPPLFTVNVQGLHEEAKDGHQSALQNQLQSIPADITTLKINNDTPSDTEWALLGKHFSKIKNLEMDTGFNEELNDKHMPLHWPLQRLLLGSACGEIIESPWVRQGRISHLIMYLTHGLRFEGPTSKELQRMNKEAIARGEKEQQFFTVKEGTPEERKISVVLIPELVNEWLNNKYSSPDATVEPDNMPTSDPINLHTLEILENDALDTFSRMIMALPHLVTNLHTLNLRSTNGFDFSYLDESMFRQFLPQLSNLKTLRLTVGEVFRDPSYLPTLYDYLPPNLTSLSFRGPVSLCRSERWGDWLKAFESTDFLPNLQNLGFVLDLYYQPRESDWVKKEEVRAPDYALREACEACEDLYEVSRRRGITIYPVYDEWAVKYPYLRQVDNRWR